MKLQKFCIFDESFKNVYFSFIFHQDVIWSFNIIQQSAKMKNQKVISVWRKWSYKKFGFFMNLSKTSFYIIKQTDKSTEKIFFFGYKICQKNNFATFTKREKEVIWSFNIIQQSVKMKNQKMISVWRKWSYKKFGFFMNLSKTSFYIIKQTDKSTEKRFFLFGSIICQKNNFATFSKREKKVIWSFNIIQQSAKMKNQKVISVWRIWSYKKFGFLMNLSKTSFYIIKQTDKSTEKNFFFFLVIKSVKKIILQHLPNEKKDFFFWLKRNDFQKKWFEALTLLNNLPKWKIKRWFRFWRKWSYKKFGFLMNLSKTSFYIIKQTDKSTEKKIFFLVIKSVKKIILQHFQTRKEVIWSFNIIQQSAKMKNQKVISVWRKWSYKKFGFFMNLSKTSFYII